MKIIRNILVTAALNFISLFAMSQCDNFSYHMQEIVTNVYDVENSCNEAYILIRKASFSEDMSELKAIAESAYEFSKGAENSVDYAEISAQQAIASAEECYCVTGQNFAFKSETAILEMADIINEANKLIKKAIKAKTLEEAQQYAGSAMEMLKEVNSFVPAAEENASDGQYICN